MSIDIDCPLATDLAGELREARERLTGHWLERIRDRVAVGPKRVFPTDELLDHVPILVDGIAGYLEDPADEITADVPVVAKAMELGEMRHEQGFEAHEILKEYEILGGILFNFLTERIDDLERPCTHGELLACAHRLFRSVAVIQQVTMDEYLRIARERASEREERLRGFNRALSHEIKNKIGAIRNATRMLGEDFVLDDERKRRRFRRMVAENTREVERIVANLAELARVEHEARQKRNVRLPEAAAEAVRQLRDFAEARAVDVRISGELPAIEVPASTIELALSNYLSNAIKYNDPQKDERWVEVRGRVSEPDEPDGRELVVEVADNGRGVPPEARERLFERFFRAPDRTESEVEGTGLGLSIVKDTVESVGGRVWADFSREGETVFALALPSRRAEDGPPEA